MRYLLTLLLLAAGCTAARAHGDSTQYLFPVRQVAGLYSANFGELRPGHFHGGVDIKTDGAVGKELVAVADGYVSRLSVAPGGYGRALYITLRNGHTAVYGHILRFRDDLEQRVDAERRRTRRNSVNLWFRPDEFPVTQGDVVARSGNSGSSFGPHLHFELRQTSTQRTLNTVRMGIIRPEDHIAPLMLGLRYAEVDTLDGIPVHGPLRSFELKKTADGCYRTAAAGPLEVGPRGYFVIEASDRRDGVYNRFGLYRVSLDIDGERRFEYRMDGFTFDRSRSCDAVSCYPLQSGARAEVLRLARLEGAPAEFYPTLRERGLVRVAPGSTHHVRIEAEDDCGNVSTLEFDIRGGDARLRPERDTTAVAVRRNRDTQLRIGDEATLRIPTGALHESLFARPVRLDNPATGSGTVAVLSPAYRFLDSDTPLAGEVMLSLQLFVPEQTAPHVTLAVRNRRGKLVRLGGTYNAGRLTARIRTAGEWLAVADTVPPTVRPLFTPGGDLSRSGALRFRLGDNFSGIASYDLYVDGEWVPCDRYPMQGTLEYHFTGAPTHAEHSVLLVVKDGCNNETRWEGTFRR